VLSAVFYGEIDNGAPASGPARAAYYGHAYSTALLVTVGFAAAALLLAIRDVRHSRAKARQVGE
jgi:hypothetical protein